MVPKCVCGAPVFNGYSIVLVSETPTVPACGPRQDSLKCTQGKPKTGPDRPMITKDSPKAAQAMSHTVQDKLKDSLRHASDSPRQCYD